MSSKGDIRMVGDYVIRDGDYLFTLGNILNKRFTVENGGTISWNGAIDDANLNLRALYRTKASLSDIYGNQELTKLQERLPVECILSLSSKLMNPAIKFDILLPTADEQTREYLRVATDTEERLSRQFVYLLVMNSFYPDPSLYSGPSASGSGGQVSQTTAPGAEFLGVTTTTEMLSNQLSNWLSQISNDFDIGFNYRPGNEITDQEVEVALSTQLLNNKVTLNGNVDVGGNQLNTNASAISGEFTIEVKLTEMLRLKVFNRSNNNLYYQVHPYTQGVGIFYRRDFDTTEEPVHQA
ncbi:MAG: translocation/assembly module TamB domain-containing protein [Bacteroidales bacterium]|nr:translocation/assembly module TamB domain-containing protein [Bacteroidales bacterium]